MRLRIAVFYGSVRTGRQGIRAARFIVNQCGARGHDVHLIDPLEYQLPLLDRMYKEYAPNEAVPPLLQKMATVVRTADAYIVVSGEYNHGVPPALSNLLDHFLEEYFWKPSAIVCYSVGSFGGVRAAMALRPMLCEMGMSSIPSLLPVPRVHQAFDEDGKPADESAWNKWADKFLKELEWYAVAMKEARVKDGKDATPDRSFCEALQPRP
jgi:NAD(P)H-dependent FMN reductase